MSAPGAFAPRRILVALDPAGHGSATSDAGAGLAARFSCELEGLFVEDADLLRLARSPLAHHVTVPFGVSEPLDTTRVEADLAARGARARGALETAARRHGVRATFRSVRGRAAAELLEAAGVADLLVLGWSSGALSVGGRMGRTARAVLDRGRASLLLLRRETRIEGPVFAWLEDSPQVAIVAEVAARLAGPEPGRSATLIVTAPTPEGAFGLRDRIRTHLRGRGEDAVYRSVVAPSALELGRALAGAEGGLLVMPAGSGFLGRPSARELLEELRISLLLLRL